MYLEGFSGRKCPLYAIHKYVAILQKEYSRMSSIPNQFNRTSFVPVASNGEPLGPVTATNRTSNYAKTVFNSQIQDPVTAALEGVPKQERGSRSRPRILRYPQDIATGQIPHVMQFKVFWRFEPRDLKEGATKIKQESEQTLGNLQTLHSLIENDVLTRGMVENSGLGSEKISALLETAYNPNVLKTVNPASNDSIASLLRTNPDQAKQLLEETISSYQTRVTDISTDLDNGIGKVGLDEQERLLVQNRLSEKIESTSAGDAAITFGGVGAVLGGLAGFLMGGGKGALIGAGIGGAAGAAGGAGAVGLAKAFKNDAVYDQMVSVYLPFCTKINNEDTFQYEDTSQAVMQGLGSFAGSPLDTAMQGAYVGADKALQSVPGLGRGLGGAVGAGTGKVLNPVLEKLFKQKDFRNFSFSWEFYPRNQAEADTVRDIIETFRYHSHPARDADTESKEENKVEVILRVPAEFEIRFLSTNPNPNQGGFVENEYIPKIARCALNSVSVDYTPNSIWSSFENNAPTAVTMTLQFSEMGLLTREDISKGY